MKNIERVHDIIKRSIERFDEVGAAFVLTRDGETEDEFSYGYADKVNEIPMSADTICRAFSCSKVSTSTVAMQLIERGLLDLESRVEWYIPEFSDAYYVRNGEKIKSAQPVKIRDLLNMTSGIPYPGDGHEGVNGHNELWGEMDAKNRDGGGIDTQEFARRIGKLPLMFEAGGEWMYGASADVLGAVIEKIAGKSLDDFMRESLFDPLQMNDTAFFVPPEKKERLGAIYECAGESPRLYVSHNLAIFDVFAPPAFQSAGAGLFSTARDYSRLGGALSSGGKGILGRKTIEFMATNGLSADQRKTFLWDSTRGFGYGNLLRIHENMNASGLSASLGAFGWDGWTGTFLLVDQKERLSVTVFVQRTGGGTTQLARSVVNGVYSLL